MTRGALLAACACCCLIGLSLASEINRGPPTLTIDTNRKNQKVADFPHHQHQQLEPFKNQCDKCHHATKPGKQPGRCGTCHKRKKKKDPESGASGFKPTFHKLCGACHLKDKPTPKKCRVCHKKKD
jgi:hypothetical protein